MNVIIVGCGRVGEQLAYLMSDEGHDVTVVDVKENALVRLGPGFKGRMVTGVGFDREVLVRAGIEAADAFAATSSSDNVNIIAARIARNHFHVPRVVARLYDPRRAEIYRRLGLLTISSTIWGAERIRELIVHSDLDPIFAFGDGEVSMVRLNTPPQLVGRMVKNLNVQGEISVTTIVRDGKAFIPLQGTEFRNGDILHVALLSSAIDRFNSFLGLD
jgi:trk system potassium uptake protein TrkA